MKRLYKSRKNKVIDGVCGGIAEYFDVDPVIVRIAFVLFLFLGGSGLLAYIIGMIIIPSQHSLEQAEQSEVVSQTPAPSQQDESKIKTEPEKTPPPSHSNNSLLIGIILVILGAIFLMGNFSFFHSPYWWIRNHLWDLIIPGIMIALGVGLLFRRR